MAEGATAWPRVIGCWVGTATAAIVRSAMKKPPLGMLITSGTRAAVFWGPGIGFALFGAGCVLAAVFAALARGLATRGEVPDRTPGEV